MSCSGANTREKVVTSNIKNLIWHITRVTASKGLSPARSVVVTLNSCKRI